MTFDQDSPQSKQQPEDWLGRFESLWKSGSTPNIFEFLSDAHSLQRETSIKLILADLTHRWKRFCYGETQSVTDEFGFPLYPQLEDYAGKPEVDATDLLTVENLAEEFRIRMRWGDQPNQDEFAHRLPEQQTELEAALARVVTELAGDELAEKDTGASTQSQSTVERHFENDVPKTEWQPPEKLGRYRLIECIGRGGFGEVWKAHDPKLDDFVAIKLPRPEKHVCSEVRTEFLQEGRKLAQLRDVPGIVTVYDAGESSGHAFIVSELIEGESLKSRQKRWPLGRHLFVALIANVAMILHRAHLKGFVHRDVKPGNILLRKDESPVLVDFGLAVTEREQLAETNRTVGTISYMSPEQVSGKGHLVNAQTDIYSLGVVLYESLTGRLPFVADTFDEYRNQVNERAPRPPRTIDDTVSKELERICLRCLAKRPEDRYSTGLDLARDLRRTINRFSAKAALLVGIALFGLVGMWFLITAMQSTKNDPSQPREIKHAQSSANLLNAAIEEVVWDSGVATNSYGHSKQHNRFSVRTKADAVFSFRNAASSHFVLRVRFALEEWKGRFGIFWGLDFRPNPRGARAEQANAIYVEELAGVWRSRLVALTLSNGATKSVEKIHLLQPIDFTPPPLKHLEFELEVKGDEIVRLRIQDKIVRTAAMPRGLFQCGRIGIFCTRGYFVVTEAWFINKEKQNAKIQKNEAKQ